MLAAHSWRLICGDTCCGGEKALKECVALDDKIFIDSRVSQFDSLGVGGGPHRLVAHVEVLDFELHFHISFQLIADLEFLIGTFRIYVGVLFQALLLMIHLDVSSASSLG